jgi:hypothetical protein
VGIREERTSCGRDGSPQLHTGDLGIGVPRTPEPERAVSGPDSLSGADHQG